MATSKSKSKVKGAAAIDATIVIPVYNEQGLIEIAVVGLIEELKEVDFSYEIIISENGSTDETKELAYQLERKFPQVRVLISDEPNYGKALRRGIVEAKSRFVLCDEIDICDVDFQQRAMAILFEDQADMVVGSKRHPEARDRRPLFRRAGTVVINFLLRVFLEFNGTDTHGLKAFNRERLLSVVNRCVVDKDLFASEFVIRAERSNFRVVEVPVEIIEKRPPTINLTRRVPHVLKNLVRLIVAIRIRG